MMKKMICGLMVLGCVNGNAMEGKVVDGEIRSSSSLPDLSSKPVIESDVQKVRRYSDGDIDELKKTFRRQVVKARLYPSTAPVLRDTWDNLFKALSENDKGFQDLTDCCISLLEYIESKGESTLSEDDYIMDDVAVDMLAEINAGILHHGVSFGRKWTIDTLKKI